MFFLSPLEQFEIIIIKPFFVLNLFDFSITSLTITVFLIFILIYFFLIFGTYKITIIPNRFQLIIELIYLFIFDIIKEQSGIKAQNLFPLFFSIFLFVLLGNLIGLLPYSFTITSQIIITLSLSLFLFIGISFLGLERQGILFFNIFIPKGVPFFILPLMIVVEIISYFIRPISLSVRLFANMLAGHTLLHILASFAVKLSDFFFGFFFIIFIILAVFILEIGIAFLQSYVFIILVSIYLKDSFGSSH